MKATAKRPTEAFGREEFRDEILAMHKDVDTCRACKRSKVEKEAQFAEEQKEQGEERLERLRAERADYLDGKQTHWPFSVEEDVKVERRNKDKKFRAELDKQNANRGQKSKERRRPEDTIDVKDPNTWFQPRQGNVYPKFLTPSREPTRHSRRRWQGPLSAATGIQTVRKAVEKSAKDAENAIKRYPRSRKAERPGDRTQAKAKARDSERNDEIPVKAGGTSLEEKQAEQRESHHETHPILRVHTRWNSYEMPTA